MLIFYGPHLKCFVIAVFNLFIYKLPNLKLKTEVIFKRKLNDTRTNIHTQTITFILNKLVRAGYNYFIEIFIYKNRGSFTLKIEIYSVSGLCEGLCNQTHKLFRYTF